MAQGMPVSEGLCKRLNFCIWTQVASRAIPADKWQACAKEINADSVRGLPCCGALDIGATSDFCAYVLLFGHPDEQDVEIQDPTRPEQKLIITRRSYSCLPFFWLPENPIRRDVHTAAMIEGLALIRLHPHHARRPGRLRPGARRHCRDQ